MKLLSFLFLTLSAISACMGQVQCGRDIQCLTQNAQITFIGTVTSRDETNAKKFSATVRPLCHMYGTQGSINPDEFNRDIVIGGFGSHAGGTCDAEVGLVGETDIFFVHVNNTVAAGGVRTFGLYDPCYGAFANTTDNFIQLTKYVYGTYNAIPTGPSCPIVSQDESHIYINNQSYDKQVDLNLDGSNTGTFNLDPEEGNGSAKNFVMTSALFVIVSFLFQFLYY
jgi:hypothetical protein